MTFPPAQDQLALLRRGVEKIVPEAELVDKLKASQSSSVPLRVKYGIDPTGIDLHLGHTVPLRKMRQFQELGHQAVIIIGNYTALVGDPSGRDETRARLTAQQVEANAADYLRQVGRVIDLSRAEVVRNGDWFSAMSFADLLELCGRVTVAQLLTREDFAKRYKAETPIFLHECLYPVMQAFDSVVVAADVELGGTEQLYSFMLARDLQKDAAACRLADRFQSDAARSRRLADGTTPQQVGVMSPILVGTDGVRRMGKSLGNYIGIAEEPFAMMKKFMQLPDDVMRSYFELLTDVPENGMDAILAGHPKDAKLLLAKDVISQYHKVVTPEPVVMRVTVPTPTVFTTAAIEAAARWQREVGEKALPEDIPAVKIERTQIPQPTVPAAVLLNLTGLCASTSDARRAIAQGGAYMGVDKRRIESHDQPIAVEDGLLLWVGKKRFCRIELTGE
ncbi:MAG: tyrosine--tRNA ligase [Planctomycetes bacterium]|nr:tyrosine--tRNA ligase [Planctomycetota bacterium]